MNGGWEKVQLHFHRSLSKKIWLMPQGQCFYFCNISIYFQWVCIFLLQWPRCYKWDPGWEGNQVSIPSVREGIMNPPPPTPHPTTTNTLFLGIMKLAAYPWVKSSPWKTILSFSFVMKHKANPCSTPAVIRLFMLMSVCWSLTAGPIEQCSDLWGTAITF